MRGASQLKYFKHLVMAPGAPLIARRERSLCFVLWGTLTIVLLGVAVLGVWSLIAQRPMTALLMGQRGTQLPVYGTVPAFTLIERSGRSVRLEDLQGKVWIASFIFTHCPDECPLMTAEMARLQADFAAASDLRLVSITVDPDRDTPAVLSEYAAQFEADSERWLFLTGDKRAVHQLARDGFRLGVNAPAKGMQEARGSQPRVKTTAFGLAAPQALTPHAAVRYGGTGFEWWRSLFPAQAWADHGRMGEIGHSTRFVLIDRQARIRGYYDSRDGLALERLRRHTQTLLRDT